MHSFYLPPGALDLITVAGPDAVRLLQGQLTCDVAALPDPGCTRGALCNNKGRVLATFVLVRRGATFHLVLNEGLGNVVTLALKKYLPFYKCEFTAHTAGDHSCFGLSGADTVTALGLRVEALPADGHCTSLPDGWLCNVGAGQQQFIGLRHTALPTAGKVPTGSLQDWLALGLQSGQFPFTVDDVEKYTPQELHLDRNGYVSFTKGCYTGQEIVARMHYRGKLEKVLFLLTAPSGNSPGDDGAIYDAEAQVLGSALKVLATSETTYALALLPADLETKSLTHVKNGQVYNLRCAFSDSKTIGKVLGVPKN